MKIPKKHLLIFIFLSTCFVLGLAIIVQAPEVLAGSLWDKQTGMDDIHTTFDSTLPPTDIREVTINVIKVFLTFVGIICMILIILGGVRWMSSQGEEEKIRKAKGQLQAAIIGFIIILAAYIITDFIADCVFDLYGGSTWMCR